MASLIGFASLIGLNGCFLLKDGESFSWNKVNTAASALRIATQVTTYGVCQKNKDLTPIFKAVGEGLIVLSGTNDPKQLSPEQIQAYINELFDENQGWGEMGKQVNGVLTIILTEYANFYNANKDKFKDEVLIFSCLTKAMGEGFVNGSNLVITVGLDAKAMTQECAFKKLQSVDKCFAK